MQKRKKEKKAAPIVMHSESSIRYCIFHPVRWGPLSFLSFCIVCDSETDWVMKIICGGDSNVLKMFRVPF